MERKLTRSSEPSQKHARLQLAAAQRAKSRRQAIPLLLPDEDNFRNEIGGISKYLSSIYQRDWFKRIWVVQEVSVCRKAIVICGSLAIDWDDLSVALFALAIPGKNFASWKKNSYAIFQQRNQFDKSKRPHLSQLIVRHQDCLATKAEDKIFALLGLADELSQHQVSISYDTTVQDVYQNVSYHALIMVGICQFSAPSKPGPLQH